MVKNKVIARDSNPRGENRHHSSLLYETGTGAENDTRLIPFGQYILSCMSKMNPALPLAWPQAPQCLAQFYRRRSFIHRKQPKADAQKNNPDGKVPAVPNGGKTTAGICQEPEPTPTGTLGCAFAIKTAGAAANPPAPEGARPYYAHAHTTPAPAQRMEPTDDGRADAKSARARPISRCDANPNQGPGLWQFPPSNARRDCRADVPGTPRATAKERRIRNQTPPA